MSTTPSGMRTFFTESPLGRLQLEVTRPTGSGSAATSRMRGGDGLETSRVEPEPVEEGRAGPGPAGGGQVGPVRLQDGRGVRRDGGGGGAERPVLLLGGGAGEDPGGPLRPGGQGAHAQAEPGMWPAHRVASRPGSVRTMSFR